MKNVLRILKKSIFPIFFIVVFLIIQALLDLSLPTYTSDIVNNGIVNYGIVNIEENIRLFEEYNLVNYLVPSCFKKHSFVNRLLIEFILSMNMSLISCPTGGGKRHLNSIITASERDFYNRFGMDYRELMLYMGEVLRDEFVKRENNFLSRGNIMVKKMAR